MTIADVKNVLNATVICCGDALKKQVHNACGSDMMSDVLAFVKDQSVLITGLCNPQVIRTAEMMDIQAVVFVRGKVPAQELIDFANGHGMVIMTTELPMFVSCGILYSDGLCGRKAAVKLG